MSPQRKLRLSHHSLHTEEEESVEEDQCFLTIFTSLTQIKVLMTQRRDTQLQVKDKLKGSNDSSEIIHELEKKREESSAAKIYILI